MDTPTELTTSNNSPKPFGVLAFLSIAVAFILAFYRAWIWSGGAFNSEAFGYVIGGVFLPILIAYAIAGRRKVRNSNRFALILCVLSVASLLLEISNRPLSMKDRVAGMMKEASGAKAKDPSAGPMDTLLRDIFEDMLKQRKTYENAVAKYKGDIAHIYSAESFSNKASMQRNITSLHEVVALDQQYSQHLQALPQRVKELVDRSSLSDSDKRDFMQGIGNSFGSSKLLSVRAQAGEVEEKWANATTALYNLASANAGKIRVKNSKIFIDDERLRKQFNQSLEESQTLNKNLQALNAQMAQLQQDALQDSGLTKHDLNLDSSQSPASQ